MHGKLEVHSHEVLFSFAATSDPSFLAFSLCLLIIVHPAMACLIFDTQVVLQVPKSHKLW